MPGQYDHLLDIPHPVHGTKANINPITKLPDIPEPDVSRMAALTSSLIINNPISGAIDRGRVFSPVFEPDPNYVASDDPALKGQDILNFTGSQSAEESQWKLQEIERNLIHKKLSMYPGGGWGTLIGIMGDPTIMVPALATSGSSFGTMMVADVTGEIIRETILHSQQPLRTKLETATNIATVGIVDAALWRLGATAAKRAELAEIREKAVKYIADPKSPFKLEGVDDAVPANLTVYERAARHADESPEDAMLDYTKKELQATADELEIPRSGNKTAIMGRIKDKVDELEAIKAEKEAPGRVSDFGEDVVEGFAPGMGLSPGGRIMKGASQIAKRTLSLLVDTPYRFKKTEEGAEAVLASIEAKVKKGFGDFASMTDIFAEQYRAYRKAGGNWTVDEFLLQVHRQMETGSRGTSSYVDRVSNYFKKFDDQYFSAEQALGVAGQRRRGGHIMRIYNDSKIRGNKVGLQRVIAENLRKIVHTPGYKRLIGYSDGTFEVVNRRHVQEALEADPHAKLIDINDLEDWEFESIAKEMTESLQARTLVDDVEPDLVVVDPSSAKSRMLDFVPTRELEPWLETNALSIMGIRARQHYRSKAMREAFPDDPTMKETFEQIAEEYQALREAATTPKMVDDLIKEERNTLQTLKALRDSVHGLYGVPDNPYSGLVRTGRFLRLGALTGYGANIASTSLTDFLTPALRSGLEPFAHGLRILFNKLAKKEYLSQIRKMGVAVESVTNNKAAMLINMSHVTKGEQKFMKYYGKYSGLDWVTDTSQGLNAMSHLQTWKKWADNWANISDTKKKRLLDVGVDDDMIARIKSQWDEHGDLIDGIRLPTTEKWVDRAAADALENAVRKETFLTTLVPGKADIPLWMQTETGKFAGMFMSFIAGANQRLLVAGLQRSDAAFYTGVLVSVAAGMLVQAGKDLARGKDMSQRDPFEFIVDSVDKTGLFGWFSVPIQPLSSLAAGRPFEFTWRNLSDQMFSPPPIEWAGDVAVPIGNIVTGNGDRRDYLDLMKVTPMVNILHFTDIGQQVVEYYED